MNKKELYEANLNLKLEDTKKSAKIAWDELDRSHAVRAKLHDELVIAEGQRDHWKMKYEESHHQLNELQLQVGDWKDAAEQTIAAARGTMIDAAGERQLRELVDSVIAYQKENAQLFEVNEQLADVIENFIAAQGTSKEDDAYTALCAYPRVIYEL